MNVQLFNDLYNASEYYRINNTYNHKISQYKNEIQECKNKYIELKSKKKSPAVINSVFLVFASLAILMAILSSQNDNPYTKIIALCFAVVSIIIVIINTIYCKSVETTSSKKADNLWYSNWGPIVSENEKNIQKATRELTKFKYDNNSCIKFLPQEYQNYQATSYMALAVGKNRADTFKEAANLYEEQLHRWRIEQLNEELAYQSIKLNDNLTNIYNQQLETNKRLKNIENLEFYNMWFK